MNIKISSLLNLLFWSEVRVFGKEYFISYPQGRQAVNKTAVDQEKCSSFQTASFKSENLRLYRLRNLLLRHSKKNLSLLAHTLPQKVLLLHHRALIQQEDEKEPAQQCSGIQGNGSSKRRAFT